MWFSFFSKQFSLLPSARSPMPRNKDTGKFVLEKVKEEQRARQAARTSEALARIEGSSDTLSETQERTVLSPTPSDEAEVTWTRHLFGAGNLVIFSRGTEAITIRKAPVGDSWFIDFGNPPQPPTQPE